jgi:AcrR family transcriptional regulator
VTAVRQRKSAEERKREIIATALDLAATKGPEYVSTEAIAAAIGLSQPAVFRHFRRKDDIWLGVFEWLGQEMQRRWAGVEDGAKSPEERLLSLVRAQLELVVTLPALPAILFTWQLQAERSHLRDQVARLLGGFYHRIRGVLGDGAAQGRFRDDVDRAAWLVISIIQGSAVRWCLMNRGFDLPGEAAAIVKLALAGLRSG